MYFYDPVVLVACGRARSPEGGFRIQRAAARGKSNGAADCRLHGRLVQLSQCAFGLMLLNVRSKLASQFDEKRQLNTIPPGGGSS
jgi:hypothetical protein